MAKKKKKKKSATAVLEPKPKKDLPTQELFFTLTVPRSIAHELWEMRHHHWNISDPGWSWIKVPFMSILLAHLQAGMRSQVPALVEIGQRISSATPMLKLDSPRIVRDATGHLLEAVIEPSPALRELQIRLGQSVILAGFSLQEKGGLPRPRVLLARRQEGCEPSRVRPTEQMTVTNLNWVASKAHLAEGRPNQDYPIITSLDAWPLARSTPRKLSR